LAQRLAEAQLSNPDPLEETRQVLTAYGVKGLIPSRAFSVPFLWYNILPGRSVPVRRLAIHLFELKADANTEPPLSSEELELAVRKASETVTLVRSVGECFVTRLPSGFLVAINIAVDAQMPVVDGRRVADRVAEIVRALNPKIRHLFVQVLPDEKLF
jgi:CheY-like chemotaxis protein